MAQMLFAMERAALQTARAEPRTLELAADHVIVRRLDGTEIQTIPFDPDALTEMNREYFLPTPDINFDGYADLLLIYSQGLQNIYYDGWLWDSASGRYVYEPRVRALSSPQFDPEARRVYTYEHGSATDSVSGVWAWQDGDLVELRRDEVTYDDETALFTIRTYERQDDGALALIREEQRTQEQMKSL
jgi:hypothetical protein